LLLNKQQIETGLLLENQELINLKTVQEQVVDTLATLVGVVV